MKKILLTLLLASAFLVGKTQNVVLNEIYGNPGGTNSEFLELYNSAASGNLDCYTIMTFYQNENGSTSGWYVLDLPSISINANPGYFVIAPTSPFSVQGTPGAVANLNWNDATFRSGATGGYLEQYEWNGAGYTDLNLSAATSITNLFDGTLAGSQNYFTLLFKNGVLINGFWGGGANGNLAASGVTLGSLTVPLSGSCTPTSFTVNFSSITAIEFWNPAGGNDNGYARSSDGKCGAWVKTSNSPTHTPGSTNGAAGASGSLTTTEFVTCASGGANQFVAFNITGITGSTTLADDFPVNVFVYSDVNQNGIIDGDPLINATAKVLSNFGPANPGVTSDTVQLTGAYTNPDVIVVYQTKRGCFDKNVRVFNTCAPLPVNFKTFTAVRNQNTVSLRWETMTEQNNTGFAVERNTGSGWQQVAFVASQGLNGNSNSILVYTYSDPNSFKGISQYRIRQVDFDSRSTTTEIKAVRGVNNKTQLLVYPNPSIDGKVNVVFEDASAVRDVTLSDMAGRVVKQMKGVTNNNIQFENLFPGVYSLRVIDQETGEQNVQKIVVNKR